MFCILQPLGFFHAMRCSSISESLAIILRLCVPQLIIRTGWIADQLLVRAKLNKLALLEHRDVFAEPAGG